MVKIVLILESGSVLGTLLFLSVGGKTTWHFLYLFQKIQSLFFSPKWSLTLVLIICCVFYLCSNLSYQCQYSTFFAKQLYISWSETRWDGASIRSIWWWNWDPVCLKVKSSFLGRQPSHSNFLQRNLY